MPSLNKVMLIATLGKDPEVRYTSSGTAVASFSAATNEKFRNRNGDWEEKTEWHNIILWGRLAEIAGEYLRKGKPVYVEGRLQTRKWQENQGKERYVTEVVADRMLMLGTRNGGVSGGSGSTAEAEKMNDPVTSMNPDGDIPVHMSPLYGPGA